MGCEHVTGLNACFSVSVLPCEQSSIKTLKFYSFLQDTLLLLQAYKRLIKKVFLDRATSGHSLCGAAVVSGGGVAFVFNTNLVLLDLSACSESLDISISLIASLTSSFSTVSIMRRRA